MVSMKHQTQDVISIISSGAAREHFSVANWWWIPETEIDVQNSKAYKDHITEKTFRLVRQNNDTPITTGI